MGIENFEEMRTLGFYYIDKTELIRDFIENLAKVNLFTRPRRFGKTLNMSMLKYFFEAGSDRALFDGLAITREKDLLEEYMGKFPVISISLKEVAGGNFTEAKKKLRPVIGREAARFAFLARSGHLTEMERRQYEAMIYVDKKGIYTMPDELMQDSRKLENFCRALQTNDVTAIEEGFTSYLRKMISIRDSNAKKEMKENFYHGILLGLFAHMEDWRVSSNAELGEGYSEICIEVEDEAIGIVIELKYAENAAFDAACEEAMKQIKARSDEEQLIDDGMKTIYRYGIACYKKRCKVLSE